MSNLIYVIEDDKDLGEVMVDILSEFDATIELIPNGQDALNKLQDNTPKIVYLDVHLPEVSGIELLHFIRKTAHLTETHVAIMTADAVLGQSVQHIADAFYLKPVTIDQVIGFGEQYLSTSS